MTFLLTALLLLVAAVFVVVGVASGSSIAFVAAAVLSGAAVVVLWRKNEQDRSSDVHLSDPPGRLQPDWSRPLDRGGRTPVDAAVASTPEVAINRYNDLLAAEILPSLETLSVEELQAIILRERNGLGRVAVMNRAQVLIDLTRGGAVDLTRTVAPSPSRTRDVPEVDDTEVTPKARRVAPKTVGPKTPAPKVPTKSSEVGHPEAAPRTPLPPRPEGTEKSQRTRTSSSARQTPSAQQKPKLEQKPQEQEPQQQPKKKGPDLSL